MSVNRYAVGRVMGGRLVQAGYLPPTTQALSITFCPTEGGLAVMTATFTMTDDMFVALMNETGENIPAGGAVLVRQEELPEIRVAQLQRARERLEFPFGCKRPAEPPLPSYAAPEWNLCEQTGQLADAGACPVHGGDGCLRVYRVPGEAA